MEFSAGIIVTLNDILVCCLPAIFFRRDGKLTLMWFFTALPYALAPIVTWLAYAGIFSMHFKYSLIAQYCGVVISVVSILMIGLTIGTHRIPLALWHQKPERDTPQQIVDWGIYRFIRHPFYSAFIVLMVANTLVSQHLAALLILAYVVGVLTFTAVKEERRLGAVAGELGGHYRTYMRKSRRFFPLSIDSYRTEKSR